MRILIVGAQRQGRALAADLLQAGHEVRILDARSEVLATLPEALQGRGLYGSPLDQATLADAAAHCDAIAAVTEDDALNAVVAFAARRELGVPSAAAVIGNPARAAALTGLDAHIVCPTARTARELHQTLVRSGVESELMIGEDAAIFRAEVPARLAGRTIADLHRTGELIAVAVERDGRVLLAAPDLTLAAADVLHVAAVHRDDVADLTRP